MPAVQETVERVKRIDVDQYRYGFETLIESDKAPKGLSEETVKFISEKKNEPAWMLQWRLEAYRGRLTITQATLGPRRLSQDRLPGPLLLFGAEAEEDDHLARRDRSRDSEDLREARHSLAGSRHARRRRAEARRGRS